MKERDIDVADVTAVIDHPDVTFTDRKGNPCYAREPLLRQGSRRTSD
jgi:hypothetical protein